MTAQNPAFSGASAFAEAVRQQVQAQDTRQSVWVAASAGAGKTRVLTSRILRLLLEGVAPQGILALTFTRAGAKEMAGRVIEAARDLALAAPPNRARQVAALLDLPADTPPDAEILARADRLYEQIVDVPGGLQIQTLHAFCQSLLGRFPFEAGVTPGFQAIEDAERQEILTAAAAAVLARSGEDLAQFKATVRADALGALVSALAAIDWARMDAPARLMAFDQALGGGYQGATLASVLAEAAAEVRAKAQALAALAGDARKTGAKTDEALATAIDRALTMDDPLDALGGPFLKADGTLKSRNAFTKALAERADAATLEWLTAWAPDRLARRNAQRLFDLNAQVFAFGAQVAQVFAQEKARRAVLDFDDLIAAASRLLAQDGGPNYVQYRLDQRLSHILVDEAQDTSPTQWQVVAGLAESFFDDASHMDDRQRTLFVVGDFKQSIYSFQGAEPREFGRWEQRFQGLAGARLASVAMVHSFRSAPAILTFVDAVNATLAHGGLAFDQRPLPTHQAVQAGRPGLIQVWPAPPANKAKEQPDWTPLKTSDSKASPRVVLGRAIARHIHRLCDAPAWADRAEAYVKDRQSGQVRRAQPGDFLVLVQNRRPDFAAALIGELKVRGVPVSGVDRLLLSGELVVQDLLALGEVCMQPHDDLALAALLKSPLFGVDEAALFDLAASRGKQSLMRQLQRRRPDLAEPLMALAGEVGQVSLYDFYATYLFAGGGRARLHAAAGPEAENVMSLFLDRARLHDQHANGDLLGFLEAERRSTQDVKRDTSDSTGQVRLMTVHGAKGLEAPIVILPDMRRVAHAGGNRPDDQIVEVPEVGPVWVPNKSFDQPVTRAAKAARAERLEAERERLFYVALTRAEERLIICTDQEQEDRPDEGKWAWYNRARAAAETLGQDADLDLRDLGWFVDEGITVGAPPALPTSGAAAQVAEPVARPDPLPALAPVPPETAPLPLRPSCPDVDKAVAEPAEPTLPPRDRAAALQRGTLMHAALEHLPGRPPAHWPGRVRAFYAAQAPDVAAETRESWVLETLAALDNPDLAAFFASGSLAEVGVVGTLDGRPVVGQIDRLYVDQAREQVHILDYKTNRPPPETPAQVSPTYVAQMRTYAALVGPLYPGLAVRSWLFWTYKQHLMDVTDLLVGGV